jgi:HEPN domain-containing protein
MRLAAGGCCRSPHEDAALLLITVRRHLRSMAMSLDPAFAQEDWGFLAQQALEKVLKASIVLADAEPPLTHELSTLADLAGVSLTPLLLGLQPFAVKARYSAEETPLPGDRQLILAALEGLTQGLEARLNR